MIRISDYIHTVLWDVIINPCDNFNGGLTKPPLILGMDDKLHPNVLYDDACMGHFGSLSTEFTYS